MIPTYKRINYKTYAVKKFYPKLNNVRVAFSCFYFFYAPYSYI